MKATGIARWVPRLIALAGVLPLLLVSLWLTWVVASRSLEALSRWPLVPAQVVAVTDSTVTLQIIWQGSIIRGEVRRQHSFADLAPHESLTLYANPANPVEVLPTGFADLWGGTVTLAAVDFVLLVVFLFLLRVKPRAAST